MKITICTTVAICDAYGAGFEFCDRNLPFNTVESYVKHPTHGLAAGSYTDDGQRLLGNALCMLDNDFSIGNLAKRYVEVFKRDPRKGYSRRYQQFLEEIADPEEYLQKIIPNSDKSGACMSVAVVGLCPTLSEVMEKAAEQARITHNTLNGVNSAMAIAAAAYFVRAGGAKEEVGVWLNDQVEGEWNHEWNWKVQVDALQCARAAIYIFRSSSSMTEIMQRSVALRGDVDTVAAISGGIASFSNEIKQNIPAQFYETLEPGNAYGLNYLMDLDAQLEKKFGWSNPLVGPRKNPEYDLLKEKE